MCGWPRRSRVAVTSREFRSSTMNKPLRLWPGVAGAALLVVLRYILPAVLPDALLIGMLGGLICALAVLFWWLIFSRAPWLERIGVIALMVVAVLVTRQFAHVSIRGGMMGFMLPAFAVFLMPVAL